MSESISTKNLSIYNNVNNADSKISIGTSDTEALVIQVLNGDNNKSAEEIKFITKTASATNNHGKITFSIDEIDKLVINDSDHCMVNWFSDSTAGS